MSLLFAHYIYSEAKVRRGHLLKYLMRVVNSILSPSHSEVYNHDDYHSFLQEQQASLEYVLWEITATC